MASALLQREDETRAKMKALGRDCYRCMGLGWDRFLHGDDITPLEQRGMRPFSRSHENCRDCGGTGRKRR